MKLIFDKSVKGREGVELPKLDVEETNPIPAEFLRSSLDLPEVSEVDVVRHFTKLSKLNYGVDDGFYPLGSCTMKYNPKINEEVSRFEGFTMAHPYQDDCSGCLELMYELQNDLSEITGMSGFSLQPAAGAHGELTGLMIMKAYGKGRTKILVPDSSHGTNPASANMCGFETVTIKSDANGEVDVSDLKNHLGSDVVGIMLTNPNTLGLFESNIQEVTSLVHSAGGLCYCDGANMNAIVGVAKPADMGFDIIHLNLHKTFSTPHGGGGPGSGPVGVVEKLVDYLPLPIVAEREDGLYLKPENDKSIGQVRAFYGNFNVMVKAYAYIKAIGAAGLREVACNAVLNANYMMNKLKGSFDLPYDRRCKHEFVLSDKGFPNGITTNEVAKRLLDYGFHAPTIYFPLIVPGAIMIEPTETESKEMLDSFIDTMEKIKAEASDNPELLHKAPVSTPIGKLDGVKAAREPKLRWEKS